MDKERLEKFETYLQGLVGVMYKSNDGTKVYENQFSRYVIRPDGHVAGEAVPPHTHLAAQMLVEIFRTAPVEIVDWMARNAHVICAVKQGHEITSRNVPADAAMAKAAVEFGQTMQIEEAPQGGFKIYSEEKPGIEIYLSEG